MIPDRATRSPGIAAIGFAAVLVLVTVPTTVTLAAPEVHVETDTGNECGWVHGPEGAGLFPWYVACVADHTRVWVN